MGSKKNRNTRHHLQFNLPLIHTSFYQDHPFVPLVIAPALSLNNINRLSTKEHRDIGIVLAALKVNCLALSKVGAVSDLEGECFTAMNMGRDRPRRHITEFVTEGMS